jgi:hypothetical protein
MPRLDPRMLALLRAVILSVLLICSLGHLTELIVAYDAIPKRLPNQHRDRAAALAKVAALDDVSFKAHTGFYRKVFNFILLQIRPLLRKNRRMAELSSGSHVPTALSLFVHIRMLRGARALDMNWLGVSPKHVWEQQWRPVAKAIDATFNNVNFDHNSQDHLHGLAIQWSLTQQKKYHQNPTDGTVAAGDGLIIKIKRIAKKELVKLGIHLDTF